VEPYKPVLKQILKEIIAFLFRISGAPYLIRELVYKNRVTIVVYHDPEAEVFRKHIEWISKYYRFLSLSQLVNGIRNKDWSNIPQKSLVVTFDDGWKGNFELHDTFKRYQINPTIFLCSHIINTNRRFWWKSGYFETEELKKLPKELMLSILQERADYDQEKEYEDRQALNISELRKMMPYVEFGSHTRYHPILTNCPESECKEEIEMSKIFLEKLLGKPVDHFSYPNGDYSLREMKFVMECEYKSARSIDFGWNDIKSDPYRLRVNEVQDDASINILCSQISGFFPLIRSLRKGDLK
jgi:peptidoglycan/xylan/chitin deacetylase (PgdA/CDA1 family)